MADHLATVMVRDAATRDVVSLKDDDILDDVRAWVSSGAGQTTHQGFPVVNAEGLLVGVVTRRDILDPKNPGTVPLRDVVRRAPVVVYEDSTLRDAADQMVVEEVGRLPVVKREEPLVLVGILSRSDLLTAHRPRLTAANRMRRVRKITTWKRST